LQEQKASALSRINEFVGQQHPGLLATDMYNTETTASTTMKYTKPNRPGVFELLIRIYCGITMWQYIHISRFPITRLYFRQPAETPIGLVCVQHAGAFGQLGFAGTVPQTGSCFLDFGFDALYSLQLQSK